jgi:hypothetical protein
MGSASLACRSLGGTVEMKHINILFDRSRGSHGARSSVARRLILKMTIALGLAMMPTAGVASGDAVAALWSSDHIAPQTDCSLFSRDANDFCHIDDNPAVELGVKFTTSQPVLVTGVRIYRVDGGSVTGSLWSADGTRLATGTFGPNAGVHGWQDLTFTDPGPVVITPGETYIASYFAPNAMYAFEYSFFTNSSMTVDPITALQSVAENPNGVFCYVGQPCGSFPTSSYRDTNYWVTPVWISYDFNGFYQPVDNPPTMNKAKAGSAIPVKFSLGGDRGVQIFDTGYPMATRIACPGSAALMEQIDETVTAGSSGLTYDPSTDRYVYVWKTNKSWAGMCYRFELGLIDGSAHTFEGQFTK